MNSFIARGDQVDYSSAIVTLRELETASISHTVFEDFLK